jgi:hypothetical protein
MNPETTASARAEITDEISKWTVGGGIVTLALFPLALPILILTAVALLPLLVPVLAIALLGGLIALPVFLIRKLARLVSRRRPRRRRPQATGEPAPRPATGH